ncbi:hypothetical protein [Streptomyces sp. MMG1121]|uniref:hypothetical protein n=1 Tax=Streptomyces sp. MMG1121 TaxID=1415544 RepID=UPI0006C6F49C|nr:hypothetical protein [Streptomyces sp. MMG1121]KOV61035.1 hypothetical protein ADK64_29045 [Streptomyces sp. MMG1121]
MKLARRFTVTAAAAAACAAALVAVTTSHGSGSHTAAVPVVNDQPGYAVDDLGYPGADKIKAAQGIVLKRGDGHITLADCSSGTGLMEVWSRSNQKICFRTTGTSGWLTLEIPSVYGVKGSADHAADVSLTAADNTQQQVEVTKGQWTAVGESADPQAREFVLMEIRTSN